MGTPLTRTSDRWKTLPGNADTLHTSQLFPTDGNRFGIPSLAHTPLSYVPTWIHAYRDRLPQERECSDGALHFFLDDYRFESVWSKPRAAMKSLKHFGMVFSPDFSLFVDYPLAVQLWNTYRSRWCGAYWNSLGLRVIPTVGWSTVESFEFCFLGLPRQSVLAISTVGLRGAQWNDFALGYHEMLARLTPTRILCYGHLPDTLAQLVEVTCFAPRWTGIREDWS